MVLLLKCYKLSYETDEAVFDDWALHIRKHYVEDDELTDDSVATGLSIEDYLREYIIPQRQEKHLVQLHVQMILAKFYLQIYLSLF